MTAALFPAPAVVEARCAGCGRPLRAPASRRAGLGPVCAARLAPAPARSHGGHLPPPVPAVDGQTAVPYQTDLAVLTAMRRHPGRPIRVDAYL